MQKSTFTWMEYCKTRDQVNYWYNNSEVEVIFACYITEKIVQLTLQGKSSKPSRRSHIVNGNPIF